MQRVIVWHRWSPPLEPSPEAIALAANWRSTARDRFVQGGAEVLLELGGSAVFALASIQIGRAIELCLSSLRETERETTPAGGIAYAITLGAISRPAPASPYIGDALDRAQTLANAAQPRELWLDAAARAATAGAFLFSREPLLAEGLSAAVLERAFPRKSDCQRAIALLARPELLPDQHPQLDALRRLGDTPGRHRVLLVAPHGTGVSQWIARWVAQRTASAWLELRAHGASLAPLSGLKYALRRLPPALAPEQILAGSDTQNRQALQQLVAIREGDAVARRDAIIALRHYLLEANKAGWRPIISVDPAPLVDPSSVGVVIEASRDAGPDVLVIMRLVREAKAPAGFARDGALLELRVSGLSQHDARALAAAMLNTSLPNEIARRAAALGGANALAVAEAVRGLVSSGDVVHGPDGFRFRREPPSRLEPLSLEDLIETRIEALAAPLRRALEVLAALPDPDDQQLATEIAEHSGLLADTWKRALEELQLLGFVSTNGPRVDLPAVVRPVLCALSPPARVRELNQALVEALTRRGTEGNHFARANLASYMAHAGRNADAAEILLEAASLAGQLGFLRSGVRLAAAAVECDPTATTRARAAHIAQRLGEAQPSAGHSTTRTAAASTRKAVTPLPQRNTPTPSTPRPVRDSITSDAQQRAVQAMLARDYEELERALELLTATGHDASSVERLRIVSLLVKGEHESALRTLARLRGQDHEPASSTPQLALTSALASLVTGQFEIAVRASLEALARTREVRDTLGERASLSVLSMCYRGLGRADDAQRLAQAALAPRSPT